MNEVMVDTILPSVPIMPADPEIEAMMKAGIHLGHAKSKNHPAMQSYLFGVRNTVSLIDLLKTKQKLAEALSVVCDIASRGGLILFVGTRPSVRGIVGETARALSMPYLTERWIGGALTNYKVIAKRVEYLKTLEHEKASGALEKYTKKERLGKDQEITRLRRFFDGLRTLNKLPDALFVFDSTHDDTAVREATLLKIPVIGLADTNTNVKLITYPIPSNDDALSAVRYMLGRISDAFAEGKRTAVGPKPESVHTE